MTSSQPKLHSRPSAKNGGFSTEPSAPPPPGGRAEKRQKKSSYLIPEMFVDPWIIEYSRVENAGLRRRLTGHLSSATRESLEMRHVKFLKEKEAEKNTRQHVEEEEVEIFF